jgi:pimeloyl-ACP methyl ester carboxylesterase
MLTEERLALATHQLSYACGPQNGPPLAMFHGVTRRWQSFLPLIPSLETRWQILAWDARGHGLSDRANDYHVPAYVADACEFVRCTFTEPGVIYGHSLGAMVALATAAAVPEMVRGVVLEDPPFETMGSRIRETPLLSFFAGLLPFAGHQRPVNIVAKELAEIRISVPGREQSVRLGETRDAISLRFTAQSLTRLAPEVLQPIVAGEWLQGYNLDQITARVKCPVLLLQADGAKGGMLTDADADRLAGSLPDCTHIQFPYAPHLIHWSQTESLSRFVLGFLESL